MGTSEDNSALIEMAANLLQRSPTGDEEQKLPILPRQEHSDAVKLTRLYMSSTKADTESTKERGEHATAICHVATQVGGSQQQADTVSSSSSSSSHPFTGK